MTEFSPVDRRLMRLAIAIGRRNIGRTWPNPSVGAVLVDPLDGQIIGQAVTQPGGRPHAEAVVIAAAGSAAKGATLYCSLEPCSHHGRTPPCADAIIAAGLGRVVTALEDPDPRVAGRGHARIRENGIALTTGVVEQEAAYAHRGHLTRVRFGRPHVTLKLAQTADGFAARLPGEPRLMISSEDAGQLVHLMRSHADAILVGIDTVLADDPGLDVRLPGLASRSPLRIILDSHLRLPIASRLVTSARQLPTWVVCAEQASPERAERLMANGVEVIRCPEDASQRIRLPEAMRLLGERGITRIFSEGGPTVAAAMAEADLLDEVFIGTGDLALKQRGHPAVGPSLDKALAQRFDLTRIRRIGTDTIRQYERRRCSQAS